MTRFELRCSQCQHTETFLFADLCNLLRDKGFLRRQAEPSHELVQEILQSCVQDGLWEPCSHCGSRRRPVTSLETKPEHEADPAWGDTIYCEVCRAPIPPERLELFPNSRQCVKCQGKVSNNDVEYCRHCGDILQMKLVSRGVTAYRSYCPSCRKTF
jgi:Prokaryotic dksA/traR C4-type zinc finger